MTTWEADRASAGTRVTAVAPLPMTTTFLPATSRSFGPGLRVHDGAGEVGHAFEVGLVPVVVAVVAAAGEEERGRELDGLVGVGAFRGDVPERVGRRPVGRNDAVVEADVAVDAGLARRVLDVLEDGVAVGDRLLAVPGPERVAQRVHVRVRTDARVAEEVPGPTDGVARLEDGVVGPRALGLEVVPGADAGQPGADDQDVEVRGVACRRRCHQAAAPISLSFNVPSSPKSLALQDSTNSVVSLSSGWKSGTVVVLELGPDGRVGER